MHISAAGVLTAVAVTVITVLVSALIPAVKAVRLTVLQALKQNESMGLKRRNVKVNPLLERLFGFEGKLADKNFKRNKRKQRVTVISIAISTALFVAVNVSPRICQNLWIFMTVIRWRICQWKLKRVRLKKVLRRLKMR